MDIDVDEREHTSSRMASRKFVPVDDNHPFDLDAYISSYTGKYATRPRGH